MASDENYRRHIELFEEHFNKNSIEFPSIDLFFLPLGETRIIAAALVAVLDCLEHFESRQPALHEIYVVAPKGYLSQQNFLWAGKKPRSNVRLWELDQLSTEAVLDHLKRCKNQSALIIVDGSLYVSDDVEVAQFSRDEGFALQEDWWAPHLQYLLKGIEEVNSEKCCYIFVHAGELYPRRSEHLESFNSVGSLAIFCDDSASKYDIPLQNRDRWAQMLKSGGVLSVLREIDALPMEFDSDKPFHRIQMWHKAGMAGHALDEIERLDLSGARVDVALKIAGIAAEAGGRPKSRALLEAALPRLRSVSDFESALAVARSLHSSVLREQINAKYDSRFPGQTAQHKRNMHRLISEGLFQDALVIAKQIDASTDIQAALDFCCRNLPADEPPDFITITKRLTSKDRWAQKAFQWIVNDALRRRMLADAFELVFGDFRPIGVPTLGPHAFIVMRELMLGIDQNGDLPVAKERLQIPFSELIRYCAERPEQSLFRFEIEDLLAHQMAGTFGQALLLHEVMQAETIMILENLEQDLPPFDEYEVTNALRSFFERFAKEGFNLGHQILPPGSFAPGIADGIIRVSKMRVEQMEAVVLDTDSAVNEMLTLLSIVSIVAPHSTQPNADLELYSHVAGRLATTGSPQYARNLIDTVLLYAKSGGSTRRRMAWFVCADIHLRLGQQHQGLVAVTCGLCTVDVKIDLKIALFEAKICTRLMRDSGLPELAKYFHNPWGELLKQLPPDKAQELEHQFVGFSVEYAAIRKGSLDLARLLELIDKMHRNAREALVSNADPRPVTHLLAQVILFAEHENIPILKEAKDVCNLLESKLSGRDFLLYQQIATSFSNASGLLKLLQSTQSARYARDIAFDSGPVAIGARRLLARSKIDASETVFALELLSDRAMALPGWQTIARPAHQLATITEPSRWAIELSMRGTDVVVIGFDDRGRTHAVIVRHGQLSAPVQLDEVFSHQSIIEWAKHYPYSYGIDEKTLNLFHVSTEGLNFPFELERITVIVAGNSLQQFPSTLYRTNSCTKGEFIGQCQPVFSAPSLGWLYIASSHPMSTDKRLTGWISTADQQGHTLVFAKERLEETIAKHSIELFTGNSLPDGFWGSELSFVVAHGSILPEGKYFQRVSDEGTLRMSTMEFAGAFKNVGVVVLFVCSAGRADHSPEGESTYGLARELLGQGCSVVVASPWPIDSRLPYYWFPTFIDEWSSGKSVAEATFVANQHVAKNFSSNLASCLAMTVFGDGLRMSMKK